MGRKVDVEKKMNQPDGEFFKVLWMVMLNADEMPEDELVAKIQKEVTEDDLISFINQVVFVKHELSDALVEKIMANSELMKGGK